MRHRPILAALALAAALPVLAHAAPDPFNDRPRTFQKPEALYDYTRMDVMIPMRDKVKLNTIVLIPKGLKAPAPMMLTRTPYDANERIGKVQSPHLAAITPTSDETFIAAGYIRVYQDVRGKYKSQGEYTMNRPYVGPLNPTKVDHSTDTYDTIDWLVKHVPMNNGRVGMIGTSYDGFTTIAALYNPHPALKAVVPIAPMVDGWRDDWAHYGAMRIYGTDYVYDQEATRANEQTYPFATFDQYSDFLSMGSAGAMGDKMGLKQLGFWTKLENHPAYDQFWQQQAMDKILAARPITVPMLIVDGLFDQEDNYGAPALFAALHPLDKAGIVHIAFGPWSHGQSNGDGLSLGKFKWREDTGRTFRRDILQPFLDAHLRTGSTPDPTPTVYAYETGTDTWHRYASWPLSCDANCPAKPQPIYLSAGGNLGFGAPVAGTVSYTSDPAKPIPYVPRPIRPVYQPGSEWRQWLTTDQRNVAARPDVAVFTGPVLTKSVHIAGTPVADLMIANTAEDADYVVKLIDVFPEEYPQQVELGGYQLMISADILRARFRDDPSVAKKMVPGQPTRIRFALPNASHVFLPGHRIMVQVQSTLFPLYDRNPQTYVDSILFAKPSDYRKATVTVMRSGETASAIWLPVVP